MISISNQIKKNLYKFDVTELDFILNCMNTRFGWWFLTLSVDVDSNIEKKNENKECEGWKWSGYNIGMRRW